MWHTPCFPCFLKSHTLCDQTGGSFQCNLFLTLRITLLITLKFSQTTCHLIECAFALSLFLSPHKNQGDVVAAALENKSWPAELEALLCLASNSKWGPESYIPYQFNYKDRVRKIIIQKMSRNRCRKCPTDWIEYVKSWLLLPISLLHITVCLWALWQSSLHLKKKSTLQAPPGFNLAVF